MADERTEVLVGAAKDILELLRELDLREVDELHVTATMSRETFLAKWGISSRELLAFRQCVRIVQVETPRNLEPRTAKLEPPAPNLKATSAVRGSGFKVRGSAPPGPDFGPE
jgi:hypothetical protein